MKILIDMNLSPQWAGVLREAGFEAEHWSRLGKANAQDEELFTYARSGGWVIFTHDLDSGTLLAYTQAVSPSVIQIRGQNLDPAAAGPILVQVLNQFAEELRLGALLTLDERHKRVRLLPLGR